MEIKASLINTIINYFCWIIISGILLLYVVMEEYILSMF